ncbi:hypothetical protein PRIPAC_85607 [Pristionchus pacificus]|uniref:Uncharacterized protein n=1 Tax=Pristionchus pacificus TaxID=54126 RepID=A0A2A6BLQ1_PRIPA|nr:hypothetical protein PRIPAC_85607 [Pristionchus pacificus]|eukprot:PDM66701.1 hypothetical protein PRIPAC_48118 [Pristionchus pacificus]
MTLLNGLFSGSRPNSPGSTTTQRGTKRTAGEAVDVSIDELFRFCLKLRNDLDMQCEYSSRLEERICELTTKVDTFPPPVPTVPSSVSLPPPPRKEIPTVTVDDDMTGTSSSPTNGTPETTDPPSPSVESDHERSIVIARLPTDPERSPEEQVWNDYNQVVSLSSIIGFPVLPVSVYRMPPRNVDAAHTRLTKVVLPTRQHAKLLVKFASRVSKDTHFRGVFIRPSFPNRDDERRKTPSPRSGLNAPLRDPSQPRNRQHSQRNTRSRRDSVFTNASRVNRDPPPPLWSSETGSSSTQSVSTSPSHEPDLP